MAAPSYFMYSLKATWIGFSANDLTADENAWTLVQGPMFSFPEHIVLMHCLNHLSAPPCPLLPQRDPGVRPVSPQTTAYNPVAAVSKQYEADEGPTQKCGFQLSS